MGERSRSAGSTLDLRATEPTSMVFLAILLESRMFRRFVRPQVYAGLVSSEGRWRRGEIGTRGR